MSGWTVSVWSDSPEEQAVVRSMLSILKGNAADRWSFSDSPASDLLLVGRSAALPPTYAAQNRRVMARFLEPGESPRGGEIMAVQRPLRAMPFLDLLNEAARQLREFALPAPLPMELDTQPATLLELQPQLEATDAIRELRRSGNLKPMALMGIDGSTIAIVHVGRSALASEHSMPNVLESIERQFASIEPAAVRDWDELLAKSGALPLDVLCWQLGKRMTQRFGLAPWMRNDDLYRLTGWPDFGSIGNDRVGFKLAAQLTRRALTPFQLSATCGVSFDEVASFLNAASLCGLTVTGAPPPHPAAKARTAAPEQRSMIARLRSRLGL